MIIKPLGADYITKIDDMTNEKQPFDATKIITELKENAVVFEKLLGGITEEIYLWKPHSNKWCILEIVCHLYDEEIYDFRARTRHVLTQPSKDLQAIDPVGWVKSKKYIEQNYNQRLDAFLNERQQSIKWLQGLSNPQWKNTCEHPEFGKMTAKMFLSNWLAHDYLHLRQVMKLKYDYLKQLTNENLMYAGSW